MKSAYDPAIGDVVEFTEGDLKGDQGNVELVLYGSIGVRVTSSQTQWLQQVVYVNAGALKPVTEG